MKPYYEHGGIKPATNNQRRFNGQMLFYKEEKPTESWWITKDRDEFKAKQALQLERWTRNKVSIEGDHT